MKLRSAGARRSSLRWLEQLYQRNIPAGLGTTSSVFLGRLLVFETFVGLDVAVAPKLQRSPSTAEGWSVSVPTDVAVRSEPAFEQDATRRTGPPPHLDALRGADPA